MSACGCDFRIKPLFGHKDDQLTAVKNPDGYVSVARFQKGEFVGSDPEYVNMSFDHPFVFLIREARRYDVKGRNEIGALRKYYFADTGLRNARLNFVYPDEGQLLETIVYNELIYNGYAVNVGTYESIEKDENGKSVRRTNEIDFYALKNQRMYYIQVCADLSQEATRMREIKPYLSLSDQIQKIVVINRPIRETRDENGFTIIGAADFLLRFIK